MNSLLRIQVAVNAAAARRDLALLRGELDKISRSMAAGMAASAGAAGATAARTTAAGQAVGFMNERLSAGVKHLDRWGKNLQWSGRQLEYRFSLPLLAAGAYATKLAMDNEAAFTRLKKVYGEVGVPVAVYRKELELLQRAFVALSNEFGVNQAEVTEIGAIWASAGAQGIALARATRLTLETMILADMTYEEAAKSLVVVRTQFGLTTTELKDAMAVLNTIENTTSIRFSELIEGFVRGGSSARSAGMGYREFAAMLAALVPSVASAAQAGNALKTITSRILAPTTEATEVMREMGIEIDETGWKSKNAVQRMETLARKFEDLTANQKAQASALIASRFQIAKFDQIMRDILNPLGNFQRAMDATADSAKNQAAMTKELSTFLASQPQAFKILWTQLQNALAQIILPLIPAILSLADKIVGLVSAFTDLSPKTQQWILLALAALVIMGPIVSYIGSFGIVLGQLAAAFVFSARRGVAFLRVLGLVSRAGGGRAGLIQWTATLAVEAAGWAKRTAITVAGFAADRAIRAAAWASIVAEDTAKYAWRTAKHIAHWVAQTAIAAAGSTATFIAAGGWIPLLIVALAVLAYAFREQLGGAFRWLVDNVNKVFGWMSEMGMSLNDAWVRMISGIANAIGKLPRVFGEAFSNIVEIVADSARAVYKLFSFFNPFAKHSPSLVEQVEKGTGAVKGSYGSIGDAGGPFRQAAGDFGSFKSAVGDGNVGTVRLGLETPDYNAAQQNAGSALNAAGRTASQGTNLLGMSTDQLKEKLRQLDEELAQAEKQMRRLKDAADKLKGQLDRAKDKLQELGNTPIKGMRKMEDQIFANEMAQKRLRLEIMKLEDAGGSVDSIRSKMAGLNGEIELINGRKLSLQAQGAGSDITGALENRLATLVSEQSNLSTAEQQILNLQNRLDELARKGEELDLTRSLKFDPLRRQIEKLIDTSKEIPFDRLKSKIVKQREEVDRLAAAWRKAQRAYEQQKRLVGNLREQRGDVARELRDRGVKVPKRKKAGGADEISNAVEAFRGGAAGDFDIPGGGGAAFLPEKGDLDKLIEDWEKAMDGAFGDTDVFGDLAKQLEDMQDRWDDFYGSITNNPITRFITSDIDGLIGYLGGAWDSIVSLVSGMWNWIKRTFSTNSFDVHQTVQDMWDKIYNAFEAVIGPIVRFVQNLVSLIASPFEWLSDHLVGHSVIPDMIDAIVEWFMGLPGRVLGAIAGFVGSVARVFARMAGRVIELVSRAVTGVARWFSRLPGRVGEILSTLRERVVNIATKMKDRLVERVREAVARVVEFFTRLPGRVISGVGNLGGKVWNFLRNGFDALKDRIGEKIEGILDFFRSMPEKIRNLAGDIGEAARSIGSTIIDKIASGITGAVDWLGDIGSAVGNAARSFINTNIIHRLNAIELTFDIPFVGKKTIGFPDIPDLAAGGVATARAGGLLARIAEGGRNEAVIPLPTGFDIGVMWSRIEKMAGMGQSSAPAKREIHFHGDLLFPNITDPADAEKFMRNLEDMAR